MLPLGLMMVLTGILGMKGAHAQCLDSVPWGTPLSFENSCCWMVAPGSDWIRYADFDQIVSDGNPSADHRILSPWVQIPASAQQDSLALMYLTGSTCREDYSVCVTTDGVHFDTLFRGRTPDEAFYYDDTLYIGAYAGQWVRFELCHYVLNSIYEPDSACWSIFTTRQLLFQNIRLESPMPPVAWMSVPEKAYVGENTLFSASLYSGSHTGLTYTWHSSLMGQTLTGDSVTMIYTAAGMDTVTMVASNAYGSDTLVSTIQVFDCSEVIAANPWMVNFETDYDCWRTVGDYGWTKYYDSGIMPSSGDQSMIASPAVALPADSTGLRLYWKDRRLSSATTYYVMVSRSGRFDLDDYDTLYTSTMQNTSLTQRSTSLADYAGDTVYIAFRQMYQSGRRVFVTNVKMYNSLAPIATLEAPTTAVATGDTVRYAVHPSQGDSLTYSWHSALLDSTIVTLDSVLSIVYPFAGPETLTVTVSNAHGALSLETSLGVFDCDTISTFPWEEEFVAMNTDAAYTVCWEISDWDRLASNYSYGCEDEDGNHETMDDVMVCNTANNYMVLPPVRVPETEAERLKVWVKYIGRMLVTISTDGGQTYPDTAYFDNVNNHYSKLRAVSLAPYAGQTVHVRLSSNFTSSVVDRVAVDYDTTPRVDITAPTKTVTDTPTLCVATLRYGDTVGLVYTWHSQVGGTFVTNAAGDSAWVTYSAGISRSEDTVSVVATNAYGSDSAQRAIYVRDCSPQTSLPWRETFVDGTACWYKPEGSKFYDAIPYGNSAYERLRHLYLNTQKDTLGSWIMSKAIVIPADTDMGATLFWKVASSDNSYHHLYSVLATTADDYTDTANYTVLYTDSSTHVNFSNYDTRSVSLAQYAGQTVHVAIHNHGNHRAPSGIGLYFDDIEVRSTQVPIVSVTADASTYYYGDTARFTATLLEGSTNGITYTWHSTMLDSTVTINSNLFTLNYTQSGVDTVTVIATNAYGSDTASVIVNSTIITQPQVMLQHTEANVGEPTVFTAVLNRCVTEGLTYTWHSTLLDTTITLNYNLLFINYPSTGVDTVTVVATNIYGSDTAVAVVSVQNCSPRALPYYENFGNIVATAAETAGSLPDCWNYYWNGSNAAYAPHVITTGGYQYMNDIPDNALFFVAGGSTGYGSTSIVYLPRFADSLQHLAMTLDYRFESSSRGLLTVGWFDGNDVFHSVKSLTGHQGSYLHDTVLFTDQEAANYRIALWWEFGSTWYGAAVDNIEVFVDNTIYPPLGLTVDSIGAHCASLSWQPVEGASAYQVSVPGVTDITVDTTAVTLCGLSINSQYTAYVAAIVDSDTGRNATVTFNTPSLNPATLAVDTIGIHCASLSWNACSAALAYHVVIDGVVDTLVADTAVSFCGLEASTQYTARVTGINGADTGLYATVQFSTPCAIADLPWFENFEGTSPLTCWSSKGTGYYGILVCDESYWAEYCHSGSRGLQMYNFTAGNTLVVSSPFIDVPINEMLVSFWVSDANEDYTNGALLEAGIITDPTDSTTFVPLMQCTVTGTPTRYEFDTRNVSVSGSAALAFRTSAYCDAIIIDDITIEQITPCARLRSVGSYALDARRAVVEWQYDGASAEPNTGALITLTDLTDAAATPVTVTATGNSYIFSNLALGHRYQAAVQALCANDTTVALVTEVVPSGNACDERRGNISSGWQLDNCDRPYCYSQTLYPATLAASVDTLFGIAYRLISASVEQYPWGSNTYSDGPRIVDVYIGQTTLDSLAAPVSASSMTLAVQNFEFPLTDTGWVHINFTNPVPLDGVSNLIVVLDDNTGAIYGDVNFGHHNENFGVCFRTSTSSYNYTQTFDPYNPTSFSSYPSYNQIPDIQLLGGCSSDRCLQPIATVTSEDTHSITLSWYQRGSETQWQVEYMIEGDSLWHTAAVTSNTTYTLSGLNASTAYVLRVSTLCNGETIPSATLRAHTLCSTVSVPYYQTFRASWLGSDVGGVTGEIPCWETGNITLLSMSRGLWNTHDNGDFIISPEIGTYVSNLQVRLSASGSTFFLAGLKVGVCAADGSNLVWLDTITLANDPQEYIVYCNNYNGSERHIAIGGSYESWTLYDVAIESYASCLPVHHVAVSQLTDTSAVLSWPPVFWPSQWAVYLGENLVGVTSDTTWQLNGLSSGESYVASVREICGVGDTAVATSVGFSTLCAAQTLPWSENFDALTVPEYTTPACWPHLYRPTVGSREDLAYILGGANQYLYLYNYTSPYNDRDTARANVVCTPLLAPEGHHLSVDFDANLTRGNVVVGLMTDVTDTNSFIPIMPITHSSDYAHYHFSTDTIPLTSHLSIAFLFRGYTVCRIDNIAVTAIPFPMHDLTLSVNDTTMGSVAGAGTYEEGSNITVSAIPNEGYHFVMWNDSVTIATRTVKLETDTAFTAFFAPDSTPVIPDTVWRTVSVTTDAPEACEVYGSGVYADSSTVEIGFLLADTAIEGGHWQFLGWSDGVSGNPRDILVTSDTSIVALFEWIEDSVGIDNVSTYQRINVYPNPASTDVTVSVSQPSVLTVIDLQGRVAIPPTSINSQFTILHSQLAPGTYFLRVATEEGVTVKKLIMQ